MAWTGTLLPLDVHGSVHRKRIVKYNQPDATLHNLFVSVKCSTCFRRFLRPSSGAQKLVFLQFSFDVSVLICFFCLFGTVFELLMMGGGTA